MMKPAPALHHAIVVVDVERFSTRINADQLAVRDSMYRALAQALTKAHIDAGLCTREDRGDGALILVPPQVPKAWLVSRLAPRLASALRRHNASRPVTEQIRLRMALHAGEIHEDEHGVAGDAINQAFRLVEAPVTRTVLSSCSAVIALILSDWFYQDVVRHDRAAEPLSFQQVKVSIKETQTTGWIRLLGADTAEKPGQGLARRA